MTTELSELRQHIRWLEDERLGAGAVEERMNEIDGRLDGINDGLKKLVNAYNDLVTAIDRKTSTLKELIEIMAPNRPPPPAAPGNTKTPNGRKGRAAKSGQRQPNGAPC